MKKTKILIRHKTMDSGGVEQVLLSFFNNLDRDKFEITLFLNYHQGAFLKLIPSHINVISIDKGVESLSKNPIIHFFQKVRRKLKYLYFQKFPYRFYQKNQLLNYDYEVSSTHYMVDDVLNSPNKKSKKVFWIHGNLLKSGLNFEQNKEVAEKLLKFDKGIFVSQASKKIVEDSFNVNLDNSIVIHNAIDIEKVKNNASKNIDKDYGNIDFVFVGRLNFQKNVPMIIDAHKQLIDENYSIKTLIVGGGEDYGLLKDKIEHYHLSDSIFLQGHSYTPEVYIKQANCLLLPSSTEGYPMVILEALILGVPCIASNVGGIPEIIEDKKYGFIIEPSPKNLYQAMKKILDNPNLSENFRSEIKLIDFNKKNQEIFSKLETLFTKN